MIQRETGAVNLVNLLVFAHQNLEFAKWKGDPTHVTQCRSLVVSNKLHSKKCSLTVLGVRWAQQTTWGWLMWDNWDHHVIHRWTSHFWDWIIPFLGFCRSEIHWGNFIEVSETYSIELICSWKISQNSYFYDRNTKISRVKAEHVALTRDTEVVWLHSGGCFFWGLDVGCGCCLDVVWMLPGIPRMAAFEERGSQPSWETQKHNPPGTPRAKQKKRNRKKMLGKLEVLFEVPVSFRNLEFLKWNMPKHAKLKKIGWNRRENCVFLETIHDIHGNVEVQNS